MKKIYLRNSLVVLLSISISGIATAEEVCPISKEEEHKALYEQYKMPDVKSVFDDCGFGDLFDFSNVTNAVFDKLKKAAGKHVGFCGFTTRDVWDMYGKDYKFPGDVAGEVIKEVENEIDKNVEQIEFPITKNTTKTGKSNSSKKSSKLHDLIFGNGN